MQSVVLVWREGAWVRQVLAYMRGLFGGTTDRIHVVRHDWDGDQDWVITLARLLAVEWDRIVVHHGGANEVQEVQEAIEACTGKIVHVFQTDTMVSALWGTVVPQFLASWPMIAPTGPQFGGGQFVKYPATAAPPGSTFATLCEVAAGLHGNNAVRADSISPEAWAVNRAEFLALGGLDPELGDLAWALRDFGVRAREKLRPIMVLPGVYAQIVDPARVHPWRSSAAGRLAYYAKHRRAENLPAPKLAATWVVQPQNVNQLALLAVSLRSMALRVDLIHVVLTNHPRDFEAADLRGPDYRCATGAPMPEALAGFRRWVTEQTRTDRSHGRGDGPAVAVELIQNFRDLGALEILSSQAAAKLGADWVLRCMEGDTLDPEVSRGQLGRLMAHPDPLVVAYNVGIAFTWNTPTLLREDAPYGDGGDLTGLQAGTNDWRLFRAGGARTATDGGRVANLRIVNVGIQDPSFRKKSQQRTEGMRISERRPPASIGLGLLAYEGEDPDAVGRWLDWTYGLTTAQVVGWTGADAVPDVFSEVADAFRALIRAVRGERVDFGEWRNRTNAALQGRATWLWTVDPDEWLENPSANLIGVRRMAESQRRAFLFDFENYREGGAVSLSSVVRLHRAELDLLYVGIVHETLDGLGAVVELHGQEAVGRAPFVTRNYATADHATGLEKLQRYRELVRVEIAERPERAQPWILLGHQYGSEGHHDLALECYVRACQRSDTAYLGQFEAGMLHARLAVSHLRVALQRLPPVHVHRDTAELVVRSLQAMPDLPAPVAGAVPAPLPPESGAEVRSR